MNSKILTLLRYVIYLPILWFVIFLYYYSYWASETNPEGVWLDAYYILGCLILIVLMKRTRGLSWLLLPLMYLIANGVFKWGSLNMTALSIAIVVSLLMATLHFFWIYRTNFDAA